MSIRNEIDNDGSMSITTLDRFNDRWSLTATGCWTWNGHCTEEGYGVLRVNSKRVAAHRVSYQHFFGPIPAGLVLDHLCRERACVNPDHLEAVTDAVNIARGIGPTAQQARQTHCKNGHEFNVENTYQWASGKRVCKTCHRAKVAARGTHLDSAAVLRRKGEATACPDCGRVIRRDSLRRHERLVHGD